MDLKNGDDMFEYSTRFDFDGTLATVYIEAIELDDGGNVVDHDMVRRVGTQLVERARRNKVERTAAQLALAVHSAIRRAVYPIDKFGAPVVFNVRISKISVTVESGDERVKYTHGVYPPLQGAPRRGDGVM